MLSNKNNFFKILSGINVNEHTETKNGLTYLSWAWAFAEVKKLYPESYYTIYENPEGWNYWTDGRTCWVKTGFTLVYDDDDGNRQRLEHIEYLPVMDVRNRSIPAESVTSFDVNKAIQRSLTKAISRFGLGNYIYAGEDLPEETDEQKNARLETAAKVRELIVSIDGEVKRIVKDMDTATKTKFANDTIVPICGSANYKKCDDLKKLATLDELLKNIA